MYGDLIFQQTAAWLYLASIVLHVLGVPVALLDRRGRVVGLVGKLAFAAIALGTTSSLVAITVRLVATGNIPIQSRYETNVAMGATAALFWVLVSLAVRPWRYRSAAGAVWSLVAAGAVFLPFLFGRLLAFRADYDVMPKPPALQTWWFPPHVTSYMLGYGFLFVTWLVGLVYLFVRLLRGSGRIPSGDGPELDLDRLTYVCASIGFPFLTLGLALGCVWGQVAWGNWWGWDIKETWALISWLTMLLYFHVRFALGLRGIPAALVIVAAGPVIFVTYLGVSYLPAALKSMHVYQ
jgi:ABC-type transport system involved in cytochrome c biogenesis permease subunit